MDDNNPVTKSDEKMRITHAGNVGIAVDNPEARLQVNEIPQSGGSTTTAASLAHFVGTTAPSTVNGFATLKLEYPAGEASGDPGAQIMFTQGYHSADPDNTQPVGSLRGYRTGADTTYGGGLQLTYQPNGQPLGLLAGITLDGDGNTQFHENIYIADTHYANWGNNSDFKIHHNGSSTYLQNYVGNLTIQQNTDDGTIVFQNDDGAGNLATYFTIDGLDTICRFSKEVFVDDNVKMRFGNGGDLNIYHDTSNSYIDDGGTGNLYIRASERIRMAGINGEPLLYLNENSNVEAYYDSALKLETTNTGIKTTGQMDLAALNTAPVSASAAGTLGEIRYTADYIYVCTATDTWKRSALSTW